MVTIQKIGNNFVFEINGMHKLWALKSQISIPKENILSATLNTENLNWIDGFRMPGTHIPGLITAGTYIVKDGSIFCDVVHQDKSIVVHLKDEHYKRLYIEVENVDDTIKLLSQ